eukprot:1184590-Prorocentrum_minimum.AAC.1
MPADPDIPEAKPEAIEEPVANEPAIKTLSTEPDRVPVGIPAKPDKEALKNSRMQRSAEMNSMSDASKRDTATLIKQKFEKTVPTVPDFKHMPDVGGINALKERSQQLRAEREAKSEQLAKYALRPGNSLECTECYRL